MKTIKIPDNLSKEKEAVLIAKEILKNPALIGNNSQKLMIGEQNVEIQELNSFIKIERISKEPLMIECSCCKFNFDKSIGKKLFTNYGGKIKELIYCSNQCRESAMSFIPENRMSLRKSNLKPSFFY